MESEKDELRDATSRASSCTSKIPTTFDFEGRPRESMRASVGWRSLAMPVEMKITSLLSGRRSEREKWFSVMKRDSESPFCGMVESEFLIEQRGTFIRKVWVESIFLGERWEMSRRSRIVSVNGSENFILDGEVGTEMNIGGRKLGESG